MESQTKEVMPAVAPAAGASIGGRLGAEDVRAVVEQILVTTPGRRVCLKASNVAHMLGLEDGQYKTLIGNVLRELCRELDCFIIRRNERNTYCFERIWTQ